jgi:hypothetical protein
MKDLLDYQHLKGDEPIEEQALRILRMMDDKTKRLAIRMMRLLVT